MKVSLPHDSNSKMLTILDNLNSPFSFLRSTLQEKLLHRKWNNIFLSFLSEWEIRIIMFLKVFDLPQRCLFISSKGIIHSLPRFDRDSLKKQEALMLGLTRKQLQENKNCTDFPIQEKRKVANCFSCRPLRELNTALRRSSSLLKRVVPNETDVRGAFLNYMSNFTH